MGGGVGQCCVDYEEPNQYKKDRIRKRQYKKGRIRTKSTKKDYPVRKERL
jgi:hypothetical protein